MDNKKNCRGKRCSHHNMYYPQGGPSYPWMQGPMSPQPMPPRPMPPGMMPPGTPPQMTPPQMMPPQMTPPGMPPGTDGWMPWMGARGPMMPMDMPPQPMDDVMGIWTMPQWNSQMWDPEREEDPEEMRDREYWMQMYPGQTRRIQREVEHQCDLMDYEGSVMYDEYPDRIALARICEAVYQALMDPTENGAGALPMNQNMMQEMHQKGKTEMDQVDMMQARRPDHTLRDLIEVMLYHEMHQRRRKHRRNRRWYFG